MSFILEALKKSEREHAAGKASVDDLKADLSFAMRQNRPSGNGLKIVSGLALVGGLGGLAVYLLVGLPPADRESIEVRGSLVRSVSEPPLRGPSVASSTRSSGEGMVLAPDKVLNLKPSEPLSSESLTSETLPLKADIAPIGPTAPVPSAPTDFKKPLSQIVYRPPVQVGGLTLSPPPAMTDGPRFLAKVVGVNEGCLIEIQEGKGFQKVTLANVSCLNPKSLAGINARRFTTRSVFTQNVTVAFAEEKKGGLLSADIYAPDGSLLNRQLVQQGLASSKDSRFHAEEENARQEKRGMWSNPGIWLNVP